MSALPEEAVLSVTGLVSRLRSCLEKNFPFTLVRGEITDLSRASSGHIYFSLKDEASQIKCVWLLKNQRGAGQLFDPMTGEVFEEPKPDPRQFLANGIEAICAGAVTFYNAGGICQLAVEFIELAGSGALAQAFEMLKARLAAAGYFAAGRKRQLPPNPARIALITSRYGAAVHDFLEIARGRGLSTSIRLFPVPVQGNGAAEKIAGAIRAAGAQGWAEALALIRGGGSLEDLWCFNDERVCRAIFESPIPVITGIGHEIDVSLADLTADVRAATPTHAAQMLWPQRSALRQELDGLARRLETAMSGFLAARRAEWEQKDRLLRILSPKERVGQREKTVSALEERLVRSLKWLLEAKTANLDRARASLRKFSPQAFMRASNEKRASLAASLDCRFEALLENRRVRLLALEAGLCAGAKSLLDRREAALSKQEMLLGALDPLEPLKRGYALVYADGRPLRSAASCAAGETVGIRMKDGVIHAIIEKILLDGEAHE